MNFSSWGEALVTACRGGSRTAPTIAVNRKPLGRLIAAFRTVSTKRINNMRRSSGLALWQRNFYEHVIRDDNELKRIREYIAYNPDNWLDDPENPKNEVSAQRTQIKRRTDQ